VVNKDEYKIMFETIKKRNVEIKDISYIHLHLKDRSDIEFTAGKAS